MPDEILLQELRVLDRRQMPQTRVHRFTVQRKPDHRVRQCREALDVGSIQRAQAIDLIGLDAGLQKLVRAALLQSGNEMRQHHEPQ